MKLCTEGTCMRKKGHAGLHWRRMHIKDECGTRVIEDEWGDVGNLPELVEQALANDVGR